jgi:flagellar assembly protein FliH
LSDTARVLGAEAYAVGAQPYLVQQVAAAALAELRRRAAVSANPPAEEGAAPKVDAEAMLQREEAAQVRHQADRFLVGAKSQARTVLQAAETEAMQVKEKARLEGFQEGFSQGTADGYEAGEKQGEETGLGHYTETVSRLQTLLENAQTEKEAYFNDREALMVELVLKVAAKVIAREVQTRPDHIASLLRQAIRKLADKSHLVVTVHPEDLERITQARADGLLSLPGVKQVEFLADDKMVVGGVRVASGNLTLDAALDSQLAELSRALLEEAYHEA